MKTIPKNNHYLLRLFTTQALRPRPGPFTPSSEPFGNEIAGHDFLVLSTRPDLTPQITEPSPQGDSLGAVKPLAESRPKK